MHDGQHMLKFPEHVSSTYLLELGYCSSCLFCFVHGIRVVPTVLFCPWDSSFAIAVVDLLTLLTISFQTTTLNIFNIKDKTSTVGKFHEKHQHDFRCNTRNFEIEVGEP